MHVQQSISMVGRVQVVGGGRSGRGNTSGGKGVQVAVAGQIVNTQH